MDRFGNRREFLGASALWGTGLCVASRVLAQDGTQAAEVGPRVVRFRDEIEPIVRWIEDTPRERILEVAVDRMKAGLSYRELMSGVFLAGIRNIQPRPVGFKFHAVLVIHSAHLLSITAPVDEWLLPMLWALDEFKSSQERDVREGDWTMAPVDSARLPNTGEAKDVYRKAMDDWDPQTADAAIAVLCRSRGAAEVMETIWPYAIRDQRNIGHKAIFAAQAWRTLQTIGWQHAEPVLRSLTYGLLDRQGRPGTDVVGPFVENREVAEKFHDSWGVGVADGAASDGLLSELRSTSTQSAGHVLLEYVHGGIEPAGIWDGLLKSANELLLRKPGIVSLHAVTSLNALHNIFALSSDDGTRRLCLLQAAAWLTLFRDALGDARAFKINELEPLDGAAQSTEALADIFATVGRDREQAARKTLGFLRRGGAVDDVFAAARRMILAKGTDSHDFKFGASAWEEATLASTARTRQLHVAAMMGHLPASTTPDSPFLQRAREAVRR